jgi:hypothetical protein
MPYEKKIWCPHPSHAGLTRVGLKPSHPVGRRIITEREAELFNKQISSNLEWKSATIKAGDKVCQTCFNTLPDVMQTCIDPEPVLVESPDAENPQLPSLDEQLKNDSAKAELNRVFQVLNMEIIRDE